LRQTLLKAACGMVLLVSIGSHVAELLDHWDHTLSTGNDVESVLIVAALCAGVVLTLASAAALVRRGSGGAVILASTPARVRFFAPAASPAHSPPVGPLRI
jgi:hypothetical protein